MLTLVETVLRHAERAPGRDCVRLHSRRGGPVGARTYGQVADDARRAASFYHARGVARGDVVALMGGHDPNVYGAWLGALWVGAVPVVLAEPSVRIDKQVYWSRLSYLLSYLDAKLLAVSAAIDASEWPLRVARASYERVVAGAGEAPARFAPGDDDVMLLQHSSGTTGVPKGVLLTHGMIGRHAAASFERLLLTERDVVVSWLPLYHDLGMINCLVIPLFAGLTTVSLSPFEWVADPELQLEAVHEHRGTISYMPNFAFALLAASVAEPQRYDLSSLRGVWSGGEPPLAEDMLAFARHFEASGFRRDALAAGYGMAETVCAMTSSGPGIPVKFHRILKREWRSRHVAVAAGEGAPASDVIVHASNGTLYAGCELRVTGPGGERLPPGHTGRVLVRAPFLFKGYFRREDLNAGLFDAEGFYDTGDVGYLDDEGHVYVTGRLKDLLIVGGRNVYAHDVEKVAHEVPGVHAGRAVCFGVPLRARGTEGAVLLFESELGEAEWPALAGRVREAVARFADLDLIDLKAVPRGALRKSTAGKLARPDNRALYLKGDFGPPSAALGGADPEVT